jgi:hypothetical protein
VASRALTEAERSYVAEVFRGCVDLGKVRITRGNIAATFSATTLGNAIHLQRHHFVGDTMDLSDAGRATLMHEMGHVWQYQCGGFGYVAKSLWAQLRAAITSGSRDKAYDWLSACKAGRRWEDWNPEQQAECISCYNIAWRRKQSGKPDTKGNPGGHTDDELIALATPYLEKIWGSTNNG